MDPEEAVPVLTFDQKEREYESGRNLVQKEASEVLLTRFKLESEINVRKSLSFANFKHEDAENSAEHEAKICLELKKNGHVFPNNYLCEIIDVYKTQDENELIREIVIYMPKYDDTLYTNLQNRYFSTSKPYRLTKSLMSLMISMTACRKLQFIHGDIKPHNIFVSIKNDIRHIVLADYGCSISEKNKNLSSGTRLFMSPEMFLEYSSNRQEMREEHPELSDMFSFGAVLAMINNSTDENPVTYLFDEELEKKFKEKKVDDADEYEILKVYYKGIVLEKDKEMLACLEIFKGDESKKEFKIMKILREIIIGLIQGNPLHRFTLFELYEFIMKNDEKKKLLYSIFSDKTNDVDFLKDFEAAYEIELELKKDYDKEKEKQKEKEKEKKEEKKNGHKLENYRCYSKKKKDDKNV